MGMDELSGQGVRAGRFFLHHLQHRCLVGSSYEKNNHCRLVNDGDGQYNAIRLLFWKVI
jgi:hypothetical protein